MIRMLLAVIALTVVGLLAYRGMYGRYPGVSADQLPPQRLQNAREAAKRIEGLEQKRADDADKAAE